MAKPQENGRGAKSTSGGEKTFPLVFNGTDWGSASASISPVSGGKSNDFFYVSTTTGDPYSATSVSPYIDGKDGSDQLIVSTVNVKIDDAFFENIVSVESLKLSSGTNEVTLGQHAFAAGFLDVSGGDDDDTITFDVVTYDFSTNVDVDGGGGDDSISGGAGNDTIKGGQGKDELVGNGGDDTFVYTNAADSTIGDLADDTTWSFDSISDFEAGDVLKVGAIEAELNLNLDIANVDATSAVDSDAILAAIIAAADGMFVGTVEAVTASGVTVTVAGSTDETFKDGNYFLADNDGNGFYNTGELFIYLDSGTVASGAFVV